LEIGIRHAKASVDREGFRAAVFRTLAHEYFHVVKAWLTGGTPKSGSVMSQGYLDELQNAAWRAIGGNPLLWFNQDKLEQIAYANHPEELAAKRAAERAKAQFAKEIEQGRWDSLLPIQEMRRLLGT
jgi:hypothetical protein